MAAQATIVLADAQGSPVNHNFLPLGVENPGQSKGKGSTAAAKWLWRASDFAMYVDGTTPANLPPIGYPWLALALRRPFGTNRNYRIDYEFHMPALEPISGVSASGYQPADRAASNMSMRVQMVIPERAVPALRYHFHKMATKPLDYTLGSGAPFYDAAHDLIPPW